MKLNSLDIEYFRCFKKYSIVFAPEITILIGKNGAGKSTLINAIHKALSFVFKKDTSVRDDITLTSGIPSLKVEPFNKKTDLVRNPETELAYPYISIKSKGTFFQSELKWEMYASTSTFSIQPSKYSEAFTKFMSIVDKENTLPVLAFYSDNFPHIPSNQTETTKELSSLRNFGYYQWNEESACSSIWIEKYKRVWKKWDRSDRKIKALEQRIRNCNVQEDISDLRKELIPEIEERTNMEKEVHAIVDCLKKFTRNDLDMEIKDLFLDIYDEELCIKNAKGDNPYLEKLPAGYKRLIYIVLDIAYRSYILNGDTNSSGIVIIDEIDLHLHPSLEQNVIQRLHETFPDIQFIISTHSALVISNIDTSKDENGLQKNKVYRMDIDSETPILSANLYGISYDASLSDFMDTPPRNTTVKYLAEAYLRLEKRKEIDQAQKMVSELAMLIGEENVDRIVDTFR
ncbi:MAG: AAA family ATPase [Tannerellaceae bacterium]|jgi:predicted ATP-binding protein involved in virulence|nr:AAA family ATPase [Tannerellaceae bacterium]